MTVRGTGWRLLVETLIRAIGLADVLFAVLRSDTMTGAAGARRPLDLVAVAAVDGIELFAVGKAEIVANVGPT